MDLQAIEKLIALIDQSSVKEFTYKDESIEISISTLDHPPVVAPMAPATPAMMPAPFPPAGAMPYGNPGGAPAPVAAPAPVEEEPEFITSPIVATFYSAAGPDIPAYVRVGDRVKAGETVCILEAMKLMNEISADFDCEIEAILVSNEQRVEYGQPLFRVKKL